ncbi:phage late control D family protein [Frankia sp. CNm7]|uniref:Phage late control D family protein n=1 Tax=Frankia nepalensis TaxID=1836974 RepID=A0A937UK01_9ACTN|nr:contractile injection system protein, VgrG/Pvc8 family [Frankia nepalensis]MBL7494826.1 phage late control D family protein [Frankia nepalensis]MBL7508975.1 phage late control D family protein [Frankia nepalensis]MBL7524785.1 phage late control D family protein [Frankia nepalensis]MBL7626309.1 phage late control D family protein [Frankia nepalensis]
MPGAMANVAPPTWTVKVNGSALPLDAEHDLLGIRIEQDLDAIGMLTIQLMNWNSETLGHTWSDSPLLGVGASVEVQPGGSGAGDPAAFVGEIIGVEPVWSSGRSPTVTVRAYDFLHRLNRSTMTRTFVNLTDSDIASRVAREAGLRAQVTNTRTKHTHVLQSNQTNLEFLRSRARRNGYEVFVRGKELHFREPALGQPVEHTLRVGEEIAEFAAWLSAAGRAGTQTVRAWDARRKEDIVGTRASRVVPTMGADTTGLGQADKIFGAATVTTATVPVRSQEEAEKLVVGRLRTSALAYVEAEAEGPGLATLRTGTTVGVEGAGTTFSGTYYVAQVVHTLAEGNHFRTAYRLRRTAA